MTDADAVEQQLLRLGHQARQLTEANDFAEALRIQGGINAEQRREAAEQKAQLARLKDRQDREGRAAVAALQGLHYVVQQQQAQINALRAQPQERRIVYLLPAPSRRRPRELVSSGANVPRCHASCNDSSRQCRNPAEGNGKKTCHWHTGRHAHPWAKPFL